MCGFFGLITFDSSVSTDVGFRSSLSHRGPDSVKEYRDEFFSVAHYRLAILGGASGAQPMESRDGNWILAFNGEIYNYRELAAGMGDYQLASEGDSRVLVELIALRGIAALPELNGMFAFVAFNRQKKELLVVRDRFGVKPLYYRVHKNCIKFASEIKALAEEPSFDNDALFAYLNAGVYPTKEKTFFENVFQVEPGTSLVINKSGISTRPYYSFLKHVEETMKNALFDRESYESLLSDAIKLRLQSDVRIGIHLSGGIDSTALLFRTTELWDKSYPLEAFTMAFDDKESDESGFASDAASAAGVGLTRVSLKPEEVPSLAAELQFFQDEPYGGIPTIAYYKMNKVQRERGVVVSLEGQGGDEGFGGYRTHQVLAAYDKMVSHECDSHFDELIHRLGETRESLGNMAEKIISLGFSMHTDGTDSRIPGSKKEKILSSWLRTIQCYDILSNKMPRTLRFNDRASAATSREIRCPLLDYRLMAFSVASPFEFKYSNGFSKAPLRNIVASRSPNLAFANKRSIVTPQTKWLSGPLRDWSLAHVRRAEQEGWLTDSIKKRTNEFFTSGQAENSFFLWQIVNLNLLRDAMKNRAVI